MHCSKFVIHLLRTHLPGFRIQLQCLWVEECQAGEFVPSRQGTEPPIPWCRAEWRRVGPTCSQHVSSHCCSLLCSCSKMNTYPLNEMMLFWWSYSSSLNMRCSMLHEIYGLYGGLWSYIYFKLLQPIKHGIYPLRLNKQKIRAFPWASFRKKSDLFSTPQKLTYR